MSIDVQFQELVGKTLTGITGAVGDERITLKTTDGSEYLLHHNQDCCESVLVEDINGDLNDLIGSEILIAEEATSNKNPEGVTPEYQDSFTWTFYKLGTAKGHVVIRWYGESNGYYGEEVDFCLIAKETPNE